MLQAIDTFSFVVSCLTLLDSRRGEDFSNEDSKRARECLRENFVAKETWPVLRAVAREKSGGYFWRIVRRFLFGLVKDARG